MKNIQFKVSALVWSLIMSSSFLLNAQISVGVVVDSLTGDVLKFVHIGVEGKNLGVISDDQGQFKIDLTRMGSDDNIVFSIIGYETEKLSKTSAVEDNLVVKLKPVSYPLQEIVVEAKEQKDVILGRQNISKITSGQSGIEKFGFGGEWGIRIKFPGEKYFLKEVSFHTRFNTVDSILYRINVYEAKGESPGKSLLRKEVFTKSSRKDKWISSNLLDQNLLIKNDIIVTFELVQIWYRRKGKNLLFYTHGVGYEEGLSYSRESSFDSWKINKRGPIAMYVTGIQVER